MRHFGLAYNVVGRDSAGGVRTDRSLRPWVKAHVEPPEAHDHDHPHLNPNRL